MNDGLDDYDFAPSSSNNLRSLFDNSTEISENSSLIYTAPKQPKIGTTIEVKNEPPKVDTSVICARVVQVWKLTDGKYIGIGKHGFAIIGSSTQSSSELILYKEKRNVIMRTKISTDFVISLKKDDFASFYDSTKDNWLIKFNSNEDCSAVINYIEKYGGKIVTENSTSSNDKNVTTDNSKKEDVPKHTEEVTNPDNKTRADILTRIAKMGQSILPNKNIDVEDHFEDVTPQSSPHTSQEVVLSPLTPASIVQPERPIQSMPNTFVISQPITYDPLNVYVAENRAQNSELRMNLSQISEKLNCLMKLVDNGKSMSEDDSDVLRSKVKVLELRTENLLKELSTTQKENAELKLCLEQHNNVLENERQDQQKIKVLEEEMKGKIDAFRQQIIEYENSIEQQKKVIEKQNTELGDLQTQLESYQDRIKEIPVLENKISELEQQLTEERETSNTSVKTENDKETRSNFTSMLKEEMNELYANIVENVNSEQHEAIPKIAQNIKSATLKIIQSFQQMFE